MRALLSLVMLAGFYLVALIELVAVFAVVILMFGGHVLAAIAVLKPVVVLVIGGVGVGLWKAVQAKNEPPNGVRVTEADAPGLWAVVRELAAEMRTGAPHEIVLVAEVNAAVHEQTRMLGLIAGRRTLCVGVPLLVGLDVAQMRAVLAHELGHYSNRHTRLAGSAYRGRLAIGHALAGVSNANVAAWPLKAYARLYLLVDNTVSRRQELEADLASVRLAGRDAAVSALRELPVLASAWSFYFDAYVEEGWEAGHVPADLFGGFGELLAARAGELAGLREEEPDVTPSRWETHPPIGARIQTIMSAPEDGRVPDRRPSDVLLADPAATRARAQDNLIAAGGRTRLDWPEFTNAALAEAQQARADRLFRTISRTTGVSRPGLSDVLGLIEEGRLTEMAQPIFPDATRKELPGLFAGTLAGLFRLAAVRSGVLRWTHSWSEPAELAAVRGEAPDFDVLAARAVEDPAGVRAELAALGIEVARTVVKAATASAAGAEVITGIANVKVDGADHDLIVLTKGLVLIPEPGGTSKGEKRLRELVDSLPAEQIAALYAFLPYEELADAEVHRGSPVKATLVRHDGRRIELVERLTSETLGKKAQETLVTVLKRVHLSS